jgi:GNAT superfamily N-acetyltransferase
MARAEAWARQRNLAGMWLDTFAFQARPFYEKLGFTVFGTLEDHPRGSRRFFMQKRFTAPAP